MLSTVTTPHHRSPVFSVQVGVPPAALPLTRIWRELLSEDQLVSVASLKFCTFEMFHPANDVPSSLPDPTALIASSAEDLS